MAWGGKPPASVTAPITAEQAQRNAAIQRQRDLDAAASALRATAQTICDQIEACRLTAGGFAPNYPDDAQYSLSKAHTTAAVMQAYEMWKLLYAGRIVSLQLHMMGPAPKVTGGRDGQVQANFIRNKDGGAKGRYNVHVDISD